jgi:3-oxoacyl-[acyl-carrier protein] reductase
MTNLSGKVAIITGSSRGIGRAIAERLAKDGASVVVNYVSRADKAQEIISAIEAKGGKAIAIRADMSKVADLRQLFQKTVDLYGQLDILVNNVAVTIFKQIATMTEEEFDALFALNAKGTFFALQEAARRMKDGGRIINISSGATLQSGPGSGAYTGSKAAVEQFTLALAKELGGRGITVNTISPGATETDNFNQVVPPQMRPYMAQLSPLGRIGKPSDIADVVAFVVSDGARWLTGQNIRVTGGWV